MVIQTSHSMLKALSLTRAGLTESYESIVSGFITGKLVLRDADTWLLRQSTEWPFADFRRRVYAGSVCEFCPWLADNIDSEAVA